MAIPWGDSVNRQLDLGQLKRNVRQQHCGCFLSIQSYIMIRLTGLLEPSLLSLEIAYCQVNWGRGRQ